MSSHVMPSPLPRFGAPTSKHGSILPLRPPELSLSLSRAFWLFGSVSSSPRQPPPSPCPVCEVNQGEEPPGTLPGARKCPIPTTLRYFNALLAVNPSIAPAPFIAPDPLITPAPIEPIREADLPVLAPIVAPAPAEPILEATQDLSSLSNPYGCRVEWFDAMGNSLGYAPPPPSPPRRPPPPASPPHHPDEATSTPSPLPSTPPNSRPRFTCDKCVDWGKITASLRELTKGQEDVKSTLGICRRGMQSIGAGWTTWCPFSRISDRQLQNATRER
jgi:hypothetical protein